MISEEEIIDTINLATDKFKELNVELEVAIVLLNDYYKRVKKAIEYIEKLDDNENSYGDYEIHYQVKKELLDILNGKNNE